jgi:ech hydrogenase subunit D
MREEIIPVGAGVLVGEVAKLKVQGYRLVTLSCTEIDEGSVDILYHFDKGLDLKHLRLAAAKTSPVPSISPVYFAALLVENEIQDHFGLTFDGLIVDYKGTLYLEEEALKTPYCRFSLRTSGTGEEPSAVQEGPAANPIAPTPDEQRAARSGDAGKDALNS